MHCSNCGSYIAPGVRFCSSCGSPANDPEATRIARSQTGTALQGDKSDDLEHAIFTVRPTLLFVKLGYAAAVIGAIIAVILLARIDVPAVISIPLALALLLIPGYYHAWLWRRHRRQRE